jgi:hypothetical protein
MNTPINPMVKHAGGGTVSKPISTGDNSRPTGPKSALESFDDDALSARYNLLNYKSSDSVRWQISANSP